MRWLALISLIALVGCREEVASLPPPAAMTAESLGHYCQMHLLEHDGPKGQIHLDGMPAPIFFSQVRDAVAYLHMPEQSHAVVVTYVQDMTGATWETPGPWIDAREAVYVIGSDAVGGMGAPEFVPFADRAAAEAFVGARGGEVRAFDGIDATDALAPAVVPEAGENDIATRLRSLAQPERN
jgi:copper chaperone NosL